MAEQAARDEALAQAAIAERARAAAEEAAREAAAAPVDEDAVRNESGVLKASNTASIEGEDPDEASQRTVYLLNKVRLRLDEYE